MIIKPFSIKMYSICTIGTKAKCEISGAHSAAVASWKASTKIKLHDRQYMLCTLTKFGSSQSDDN